MCRWSRSPGASSRMRNRAPSRLSWPLPQKDSTFAPTTNHAERQASPDEGPDLTCEADQSVPTQRMSEGIGTVLGSGMPRPGTDGRFSAGGDTKFESPEANSGVTGSGVETRWTAPTAVPGSAES